MQASEIPIAKTEQFKMFRQEIRPEGLEELLKFITAMDGEIRANKFTGKLTIDWNQGGTRRIVAEQIAPDFIEE